MDKYIQQDLEKQVIQKRLITNEYLKDPNNENYKYIQEKFFKWQEDKTNILNTWSWLFSSVAQVMSNYVWDIISDLDFPIQKVVEDYVCLWKWIMAIARIDWKPKIQYIPAENHISKKNGDYIYRAYLHYTPNRVREYYILETIYIGWIIENKLYKKNWLEYTEVWLDTIEETQDLQAVINTWYPKTLFVIEDDNLEQEPITMIDKIKDIVYSIDRKIVMFDTQFIKNVESFLLLKWIPVPQDIMEYSENGWIVKPIDLSKRVLFWDVDSSIEFINNSNDLLSEAIEYEEKQIKKISSLTTIPMDFLGWIWTAGAIWEGSRELLHWAFIKTIKNIRKLLDKNIVWIYETIGWEYQYTWEDIFTKDSAKVIEELKIARESGLISQATAVKRYLWLDDAELDLELNLINQWAPQE